VYVAKPACVVGPFDGCVIAGNRLAIFQESGIDLVLEITDSGLRYPDLFFVCQFSLLYDNQNDARVL
jgi:hypothetical protein